MQYENRPIYKQIADYLYEMILSGQWADDSRIPSIREMAVQMEVNPNTMNRTFSLLQDQGVIYNKRGIGYFTTKEARAMTAELKKDEFIREELPVLFRRMENLEIDQDELIALYREYMKAGQPAEEKNNENK